MGAGFDQALTLAAGLVPARLTGRRHRPERRHSRAAHACDPHVPAWRAGASGDEHGVPGLGRPAGRMADWPASPHRSLFLLGGIAGGLAPGLHDAGSIVPVVGASAIARSRDLWLRSRNPYAPATCSACGFRRKAARAALIAAASHDRLQLPGSRMPSDRSRLSPALCDLGSSRLTAGRPSGGLPR